MAGVALIEDKMRQNRLGCFGHVCHRLVNAGVRKSDIGTVDGSPNRGGLKLTFRDSR